VIEAVGGAILALLYARLVANRGTGGGRRRERTGVCGLTRACSCRAGTF